MGKWILQSITDRGVAPLDTPTLYGHEFRLCLRLRYEPALIGRFSEPPLLMWHERFVMKEHHNSTWWEFESNMYEHIPNSPTLSSWPRRYIEAYEGAVAAGQAGAAGNPGRVRLLDQHGNAVTAADLRVGHTPDEQARAVRHYLKRHGDILEIEIRDIPSITRPASTAHPEHHKERLLLFTIGVQGGSVWRMASQYLDVDGTAPEFLWHRDFVIEAQMRGADMPSWTPAVGTRGPPRTPLWVTNFSTAGMTQVAPPPQVALPRVAAFFAGEYR